MSSGSEATNTLDRVAAILGILNNAALCGYLSYEYYTAYFGSTLTKKQRTMQRKLRDSRRYQVLHTLSVISIFFSVLFCIIRGIIAFDGWNNNCTVSTGFAVSLWQITKSALYLYFVIRFEVAFNESSYALSRITLNIFYSAIFIQWIFAEILIIGFWNGKLIPPVTGQCVGLPPIFIIIFFSLWDVICTIGLSVLFSTKLCSVHKSMMRFSAKNNNKAPSAERIQSYDFVATIIKVLVLSIFASVTTIFCTFGVSQSGVTAFIITDTVINCWCIFLMYTENKKIFDSCCCGLCSNCCLRCFLKKEAERLGVGIDDIVSKSPRIKDSDNKSGSSYQLSVPKQIPIDTSTGGGSIENPREITADSSVKDVPQSVTTMDSNDEHDVSAAQIR